MILHLPATLFLLHAHLATSGPSALPSFADPLQSQQSDPILTSNISLFASRYEKLSLDEIQDWLASEATVEVASGPGEAWEKLTISWPGQTVQLATKSIHTEGLFDYLGQFQGFAYNHLAGGEMDSRVYSVIQQIGRTNHLYSLSSKEVLDDACLALVRTIAGAEKGLVLTESQILDDRFRKLLGPGGARDEAAEIPVFDSAVNRRTRVREWLANRELGLKSLPPTTLPLTAGDEAVRFRKAQAVAKRFLCVATVAMKASNGDDFEADAFVSRHGLRGDLTPEESAFLADPGPQSSAEMSWRYEAAWSLLWALGRVEEIGFPASQCDADKVIQAALDDAKEILMSQALRPGAELLDQRDLLYLCNWTVTDARIKKTTVAGLDGSVIYERLYALNWLIFDENADWDDVRNDS